MDRDSELKCFMRCFMLLRGSRGDGFDLQQWCLGVSWKAVDEPVIVLSASGNRSIGKTSVLAACRKRWVDQINGLADSKLYSLSAVPTMGTATGGTRP